MSLESIGRPGSPGRRGAGGLVTVARRPDSPVTLVAEAVPVVPVVVEAVPVGVMMTIPGVLVFARLAAPHVAPAHQREPDHPHLGRAGQPGPAGPVVEAAHDAEA